MALVMYFIVRRIYPVLYEWGRLAKIALAATAVIVAGLLAGSTPGGLALKGALVLLFPLLLYGLKFYVPGELKLLARMAGSIGVPRARGAPPSVDE